MSIVELEHSIRAIPVTESLQAEVEKLALEGWQLIPGVVPVAVYHLVRSKSTQEVAAASGLGKLGIDDSKIHVIRAGKVVS